ncbi:hypothetical protein E1267_37315 [Nonomuraea longispora]|uniref:DUF748 domain-containing protein n=1 Tax=Nonomuraea longispora TaxID=1848320 RepID=A0A4R4MY04_9ACTN|nr:hypothetical protein [Nonomuraea longispora]TDB99532.1 hypothetical protein E1267_37315 [Nonomuraea longispora]
MNTPAKIGSYVLGLAVVFGGALGAGKVVGPAATSATSAPPAAGDHSAMAAPTASAKHDEHATQQTADNTPGGLQVSENGYTLTPLTTKIRPGEPADFRFTVTGPDGRPVTGYKVQHDKKMHFIVVSRDLSTFQHVHPEMAADGTWSVEVTFPKAGAYRAFADFTPTGGDALTLGTDLSVAGDYEPEALPPVTRTSTVDGYTVTLDGDLNPGRSSELTLRVSKDGEPVTDLQPYLGAYGHLVALRANDLAYLHVHPDGEPRDGKTAAGPDIVFYAEVPSDGDYRLFLDFKHDGRVRTADFTLGAGKQAAKARQTPGTTSGGHDDDGHGH